VNLPSRYWQDLTWTELARLPAQTVAILPVASIEQHGPHLPVSVDSTLNEGILRRALELAPPELPLLVLPIQKIGLSVEHIRFPGTLTLQPETALALWTDIGNSVARAGVRKLVIFNSHGGQPQVVDIVCRRLRIAHRMFALAVSWFKLSRRRDAEASLPEAERRHGIHGGAVETAMMMHLTPELVRSEAIADFSSRWLAREAEFEQLVPEGAVAFGWETQDLHPSGAVGDPTLATAQMGAEIVDNAAQAFVTLLQEVHRFDAQAFLQDGPDPALLPQPLR
jgi:creatinine amidohydrolase